MTLSEKNDERTPGPIVLLTDFGTDDPFVGQMKGVITKIAPGTEIIDLCNNVPAHNIFVAAMFLQNSRDFFPHGTVFLVVVDPGVGTERNSILIKAHDQYFIGPDNGCFDLLLHGDVEWDGVSIDNLAYRLPKVSTTFWGRDVFAPAAGHLSAGADFSDFGEKLDTMVQLDISPPILTGNTVDGKIIHFDSFGNAWTNISRTFLEKAGWLANPDNIFTYAGSVAIKGMSESYKTSKVKPLALINSFNFLEIACYKASAREKLGLKDGALVELMLHG